jgi:hypothetical protein
MAAIAHALSIGGVLLAFIRAMSLGRKAINPKPITRVVLRYVRAGDLDGALDLQRLAPNASLLRMLHAALETTRTLPTDVSVTDCRARVRASFENVWARESSRIKSGRWMGPASVALLIAGPLSSIAMGEGAHGIYLWSALTGAALLIWVRQTTAEIVTGSRNVLEEVLQAMFPS